MWVPKRDRNPVLLMAPTKKHSSLIIVLNLLSILQFITIPRHADRVSLSLRRQRGFFVLRRHYNVHEHYGGIDLPEYKRSVDKPFGDMYHLRPIYDEFFSFFAQIESISMSFPRFSISIGSDPKKPRY